MVKVKTSPLVERILAKVRMEEQLDPISFTQKSRHNERLYGAAMVLRSVSDETLALILLQEIIQDMHYDYLKFKLKHPGNPAVVQKGRQFNRVFSLIAFLDQTCMNHIGERTEISNMRSALKMHRTIIDKLEKELKERDAEVKNLKKSLSFKMNYFEQNDKP